MRQILFVDDEPILLDGLKRTLRPMRHEWIMTFVGSGGEALKVLEQAPFDVVVSDMRMPSMDGAQLMNEVQRRYPYVVRIILSGYSDQKLIMQSINATHQFLAKPCEPEQLKAMIQRACALRDVLSNETLRVMVTGMRTLPALPMLLLEVKQETESTTASLTTIGKIIEKDMGMTAKILQLANSAFFGGWGPVTTVERAVQFLGLETIQTLILITHVFSQLSAEHLATFPIEHLWKESLETGALAREIARGEGCTALETEQAYTAGLLHDVGVLLLMVNVTERYGAILREIAHEKQRMIWEAEQAVFGVTHADIGAYLLGLWGVSDPIVEAVAYHHRPGDYFRKSFSPVTAVHVANVLQQAYAQPMTENVLARLDTAYLDTLTLTDRVPRWQALFESMKKEQANG